VSSSFTRRTACSREAETPEVFTRDPSSNSRAMLSGRSSLTQNAISVTRSAEKENPEIARMLGLTPALTRGAQAAIARIFERRRRSG